MSDPAIEVVSSTTRKEVDRLVAQARRPVLQVGSKAQIVDATARTWRSMLAGPDFVGLDIEAGEGVDVVGDICAEFPDLDAALGHRRFGFIIAQHILEHVKRPWIAAENLTRLLAVDGRLYVAVPWVQAFHGYPNDYWRISFAGLAELFPEIEFYDMYWSASGTGLDAAYKVLIDGAVDLARTPFEIEGHLFQIEAERDWNLHQPAFRRNQKVPLARAYLPVMFINAVGRSRTGDRVEGAS